MQAKISAAAEEITGDMSRDRVDKFVFRLQRVQEVKGSHIKFVFT